MISSVEFSIVVVDVSAGQVIRPVHDVESGKGQRKDDPGYDVDTFRLRKGSVAYGGLKKGQNLGLLGIASFNERQGGNECHNNCW